MVATSKADGSSCCADAADFLCAVDEAASPTLEEWAHAPERVCQAYKSMQHLWGGSVATSSLFGLALRFAI